MQTVMDFNADIGEGLGDDEALIASGITSANIACGGHAGDDATMRAACESALRNAVALGAHPGYEDREHFGRRALDISPEELRSAITRQLGRLLEHAAAAGAAIVHVKPHGALYHQGNLRAELAGAFLDAMQRIVPEARLFGPPEGGWRETAGRRGVPFVAEGFIDRRYRPDGTLVPRGEPDALISSEEEAIRQALALARAGRVRTLCVHGDSMESWRLLGAARRALQAEGFRFSPPL